jgi:hypothetical protein
MSPILPAGTFFIFTLHARVFLYGHLPRLIHTTTPDGYKAGPEQDF